MLKRDSIWLGLLLGVTLPSLVYLILIFIGSFTEPGSLLSRPFQGNKPMLLSLIINLILLRVYFVNYKMEKTGRGILVATFALGVIFFIFFKNM